MAKVLTIPSSVSSVFLGGVNLSGQDRARIDSREVLSADARGLPTAVCIARCTQWQDNLGAPGWEFSPGAASKRILGGTMWASALEDGGWLRVHCIGTWSAGAGAVNPTLLFRLQTWSDFWNAAGPTGQVTIGPGAGGWGWSDTQTGTAFGDLIDDGVVRRFVFDVEVHSLGEEPSSNLLSSGQILLSPTIPADGYGGVPTQYIYKILGLDSLDLTQEYEVTLTAGLADSVAGSSMHVDKAEMWLFGARHGFEVLD